MVDLLWLFAGCLVGLLLGAVFRPASRMIPSVPTPDDIHVYRTPAGCVRVRSIQVPCTSDAVSLNILATQHK